MKKVERRKGGVWFQVPELAAIFYLSLVVRVWLGKLVDTIWLQADSMAEENSPSVPNITIEWHFAMADKKNLSTLDHGQLLLSW